jgi:hypothetical protein
LDEYADSLLPHLQEPLAHRGPNSLIIKLPPPTQDSNSTLAHSRVRLLVTQPPSSDLSALAESCNGNDGMSTGEEDAADGGRVGRIFCPDHFRKPLEEMMERHFCAHPLIPGYSHPSPEGIRHWAVKQAYSFCEENDLPEVWAYLWGNWYRRGRWELWARSACKEMIPILKTTMMVESQCVLT